MRKFLQSITLLTLSLTPIAGQEIEAEKILLPVVSNEEVSGGFGSRWVTRLSIVNGSTDLVLIDGYNDNPEGCQILCPGMPLTPGGIAFYPTLPIFTTEVQGFFLRVDRRFADQISVSLRAQDVSRQSTTWGTELPVVRESEWFTKKLQIQDVPVRSGFRQHLRIYDIDRNPSSRVKVRFYAVNPSRKVPFDAFGAPTQPDRLLLEREETFTINTSGSLLSHPGYAEIRDFSTFSAITGNDVVRIEIEPLTAGLRFWAFVSVVNNETQHLTTLTPQ